ncbi:MAG: YCF48-related protein [Armatimonadota bacterium]
MPTASVNPTPVPTPTLTPLGSLAWAIAQDTRDAGAVVRELVIHSSDGGLTWETEAVFENQPSLQAIQFIDRDLGWVVGGRALLRSTDGGRTWTDELDSLPLNNVGFGDVAFRGRERGIVVGSEFDPDDPVSGERFPAVLYTGDGGTTWQLADVPRQVGVELDDACLGESGLGLAVGTGAFGGTLALLTRDGGVTWSDITASVPLAAVVACPGEDLWALGGGVGPSVLRSSTGGETWEDLSSRVPIEAGVQGVAFADSDNGWLLGASRRGSGVVIVRTRDAGQTWSRQPVPGEARTDLWAVAFASVNDGVIVGSELSIDSPPLILATTNGGESWDIATIPDGIFALLDVSMVPQPTE